MTKIGPHERAIMGYRASIVSRMARFEKRKQDYLLDPSTCTKCGIAISYEKRRNKFCSHSCAASCTNKSITRRKCKSFGKCLRCGSEVSRKSKYCCMVCRHEHLYESYIDRWKRGEESGVVGSIELTSDYIHRYIREKYGEKCCQCGWAKVNTYTGNIPVQLNHIDGNAINNKEENLEILCPSCHSLTPTFGGRNRGNGRKGRRKINSKLNSGIV